VNTRGVDLSTRKTGLALLCTPGAGGEFPELKLPGKHWLVCQWEGFRYYGAVALRGEGSMRQQTEDILFPVLEWARHAHHIVIEGYAYAANQQYKDANVELGGVIRYFLRTKELAPRTVSPKSLKKFIAGNGNADKVKMLAAVQASGMPIVDDNMADAFGLARIGHALQLPESDYLNFHHTEREALMAIKYPAERKRKRKQKEKPVLWSDAANGNWESRP
jgi:Holliday junction resolvasome RuvABC endonuclease subunit